MNIVKYITHKKYRFFQKKIKDVTASLWELDFKISKARAMREASRQARDNSMQMLNLLKKNPKPDQEQITQEEARVKGYEAQMSLIDGQINGVPATPEADEVKGLMEYMDGLADLRAMYIEYSSKI